MDDLPEQYTLELAERPGYLKVIVHAEVWTPAMANEYNLQLAKELGKRDPERLMIVRDIPVTLRLVAVFSLMSDFVDGVGPGRKVAVVNPFPELREDLKFAIQVATHRGADYMLFDSIPEAEVWLLA